MKYLIFIIITFYSLFFLAAEKNYTISLKDWPADISLKILTAAPEIGRTNLDLEQLNTILKKIDNQFNFSSLKFIKSNNSNELLLVGEIAPVIKEISFSGLSDINEPEALSLMNLSANNILDEENLKSGVEKLAQFYRELGYRFAIVKYEVIADSSIAKKIKFIVLKKEKTLLVDIKIDGLDLLKTQKNIEIKLQKDFRLATLNQETLNKISTQLRQQLSKHGYYLIQVPSPQITFTASELEAKVSFKLKPAQRYKIEVVNTKRYEHIYLEEQILKLDTYFFKDQNMSSDLAEKLKTFYIANGYPHVNIPFFESKKNNTINLYLNVEEGAFTQIKTLKFTGQYSRSEDFYKNKFYEVATAQVKNNIYLKEDIELAAKNLLIYLQNEGFVNAKFSRVYTTTNREAPSEGIVVIQIEEGAQVQINQITYTGVSDVNLAALKDVTALTTSQNLSLAGLELTLLNIKNFYQNQGYIEYALTNENTDLVTYFNNNTQLNLNFKIQEGPKVEVQSIVTEGNTRTNDKLIFIELDFKPGDILTPAKIEESISRLQRTGHFNSVEITTLEKDTPTAQRTVVIKVAERDPGLKVLGAGATSENQGTIHGYAGVAYRNFEGWGIGASFRSELNYNFADIKYLEQKHTFGFVLPYLFDTRARFRTSATRSNTISDININKVTEANTAIFSLEQDFTSHMTGLFSYSVSTFKDHGITNADETKFGYSSESLVIGSIGPTLDLDYRDNLFNPTKGSFSRFSLEYAVEALGSNNVDDFYRITGQTTHYFPYKDSGFIFVQSLRGGYIKDIENGKEGIPNDKRGFSLGGRTTIRGFASTEFFPTTTELGASYRLRTSSSYQLVKSELRFPLSTKYDIAAAIFYDGGRVQIEGTQLVDGWRDAAGFGIRYNTPVGPLNLEYGHKLQKRAGESDGAFHLSIGVF